MPWQIRKKPLLRTFDSFPRQQLMIAHTTFLIHKSRESSSYSSRFHKPSLKHQKWFTPCRAARDLSFSLHESEMRTLLCCWPSSLMAKGRNNSLSLLLRIFQHSFPAPVLSNALAVFIATREVSAQPETRNLPTDVRMFVMISKYGLPSCFASSDWIGVEWLGIVRSVTLLKELISPRHRLLISRLSSGSREKHIFISHSWTSIGSSIGVFEAPCRIRLFSRRRRAKRRALASMLCKTAVPDVAIFARERSIEIGYSSIILRKCCASSCKLGIASESSF